MVVARRSALERSSNMREPVEGSLRVGYWISVFCPPRDRTVLHSWVMGVLQFKEEQYFCQA